QLPFGRPVLGDVGQPQLVRAHGGEVSLDEIVVHGRACLAVLAAAFLADGAGPAADRADPPGGPPAHLLARGLGFVGEVAVSELWVFAVGVEQGVGAVCLGEFGIGDRVLEPSVVGLTSYSKYPPAPP